MGMFSVIVHNGVELQFKHGWDDCCRYKVGDKIDWTPDPYSPGSHIDGVHDSCGPNLEYGPWVIIKDCVIVALEPRSDDPGSDVTRLLRVYRIGPPDPKLWTEKQWKAKAAREAKADADYKAWAKIHGDNPISYFMHIKMREKSFIERIMPARRVRSGKRANGR